MVRKPAKNASIWALVAFALLLVAAPFLWIVVVSLKYQIAILMGQFPFEATFSNYQQVLFGRSSDFPQNLLNSLIVGIVSTVVVLAIGTLAAYSLAWRRSSGMFSAIFLAWTLIFNIVPPITLVGPWYVMFRQIGLFDTLTALVLTHIVINLPMTIWLMMAAFDNIPRDLEQAAMIDGCRRTTAFRKILLPLVVPGLIAAGLLAFIFSWSEFSIALNLTAKDTMTVPVAIAAYAGQYEIQHGEMAAASVLSALPAIVLMFLGQRFIVRGLTAGSVK
ncbi:MAG: ABC transporter permease [Martelella sp.]|uniref:carbohydrate ABC transporter permease n=1 Tax=unclassified Martelella TaxID=2629616 RepID=UPI000C4B718E|nr:MULTISPECIES: carbohydrate ABC transporter permease [unclassified Martelella]MAU19771.1 ABC transporter permease [Martelella sp.]|tara:strand:- start:275 stop:1102 length:828 start_codon:yes stop_codon:yes gene_type:complete